MNYVRKLFQQLADMFLGASVAALVLYDDWPNCLIALGFCAYVHFVVWRLRERRCMSSETLFLRPVTVLGMELIEFRYKGVEGHIGVEDDRATIYDVESSNPGQGECQECLSLLKQHYEEEGKRFGCSVALNAAMRHILEKLGITEYSDEEDDSCAP